MFTIVPRLLDELESRTGSAYPSMALSAKSDGEPSSSDRRHEKRRGTTVGSPPAGQGGRRQENDDRRAAPVGQALVSRRYL